MKDFGKLSETLACNYLIQKGLEILERNFKTRYGEIDIIARDISDNSIVFVEVKARTNNKYGYPEESLTHKKKEKIIKSSFIYINMKNLELKNIRYDVITINKKKDTIFINYIKNALDQLEE